LLGVQKEDSRYGSESSNWDDMCLSGY